ncbi:MAG TPA: hypothetical protein DCQ92_04535 [Verrucomicrobia subdivision 3 bacterium]|nr:hypothetical protein [Limisphaerales bacterium]
MNIYAYKFDISRATDAGTLHAYAADAKTDDTLPSDEKEEVLLAIHERFCFLNARAAKPAKGRWD